MTTPEFETLFEAAVKTRSWAHAPYSKYQVGAAVLMDNGQIYGGCNVENASYGGTVCAERVAIWKGISEGAKSIRALLVVTDQHEPWPPCGLCRQVITEFASNDVPIYMTNLQKTIEQSSVAELCPQFFTQEAMK